MILLALMQATEPVYVQPVYEKPLNDTLILSAVAKAYQAKSELHLRLISRRGRQDTMPLTVLSDAALTEYRVIRTDDSTIVIRRAGTYEWGPTLKLFLDPEKKFVVKQIDYPPDIGLGAVDDREVAAVLETRPEVVQQLERNPGRVFSEDLSHLPRELREHPMPQSTYAEFARARPQKVGGYRHDIDEQPGPCQITGARIWFGKAFHEDEGAGVGGLGYFDTSTLKYTFLPVPGLTDWSASAILIEDDAAWIGLAGYPEGETYGGGLLRYDFKARTSRRFAIEEVVYRIVRSNDRIYVATRNGAYQVQGNTLKKRYRVEPDTDHRFIILTESLPPKPADQLGPERR